MKYYDFEKESLRYTVERIPVAELFNYNNGIHKNDHAWGRTKCIIMMDIFSERTAHLLNYIFNIARDEAEVWTSGYGGGMIIDSGTNVIIDHMGNVGLKMNIKNRERVTNSIVFKATVFKRIKAAIKSFVKFNFEEQNVKSIRRIKHNGYEIGTITLNELNLLMDFFAWKDLNKKYSNELIDETIGKKSNDQFVISAVEVLMNEVRELLEKEKTEKENLSIKYRKDIDQIKAVWKSEEDAMSEKYKERIDKLNQEILQFNKIPAF